MRAERPPRRMAGQRWLGVTGLIAVGLSLPAFVAVPPLPPVSETMDDLAAYFASYRQPFLVYGWLLGLSIPVMLAHVAVVASWLRTHPRLPTSLWLVYAIGGCAAHTVQAVLLGVFQVLGMEQAQETEAVAVALWLGNVGFAFYAMVQMLPLGAGALAIWQTRAVWRVLAIAAVAGILACVVGSAAAVPGAGVVPGSLPATIWYGVFLATFAAVNVCLLVRPVDEWSNR